jgi:hypothetical protein
MKEGGLNPSHQLFINKLKYTKRLGLQGRGYGTPSKYTPLLVAAFLLSSTLFVYCEFLYFERGGGVWSMATIVEWFIGVDVDEKTVSEGVIAIDVLSVVKNYVLMLVNQRKFPRETSLVGVGSCECGSAWGCGYWRDHTTHLVDSHLYDHSWWLCVGGCVLLYWDWDDWVVSWGEWSKWRKEAMARTEKGVLWYFA